MGRIRSYDDDMNNFAFEKADEEIESDEELLSDWSTEGPDEEPSPIEDETPPDEGEIPLIKEEADLLVEDEPSLEKAPSDDEDDEEEL